ncbi:hypothetical protein AZE42_11713 [Rhizopogon vesiculosus]|uniref:Uncharacterized protein n=1 Tax=Rhizopogon vesiculosus TaxID=180088 RepID=A0A1J8QHI1_9AGAM|nr:hypothetical protein AZE42_11713 [Rhizopogon vesiculosus]
MNILYGDIINESNAVTIAYGLDKKVNDERTSAKQQACTALYSLVPLSQLSTEPTAPAAEKEPSMSSS